MPERTSSSLLRRRQAKDKNPFPEFSGWRIPGASSEGISVDTLKNNVDAFERSIGEYDRWKNAHAAAVQDIRVAIAKGGAATRRLDVIIRNKLQAGESILAAWDRTHRLVRVPRAKTPPGAAESS